ncbi:hypothetical protein [Aliamphritea spongicola]|nr:hypothetical protein [Aliamphritea spongicola]
MKPEKWSDPSNKLFPHQVGFTAPPMDFDAAPTDFCASARRLSVSMAGYSMRRAMATS